MDEAFYALYSALDRGGPGEEGDVAWAFKLAGLAASARICDAGCGTGGDIPALLAAAPEGRITALDIERRFVDEVLARFGDDERVTAYRADFVKLKGPFDLIWCAGAAYFLGLAKALNAWRPALAPGGAIAFSKPAFFVEQPSDRAIAFWGGFRARQASAILADVTAQHYEILGERRLSETAWDRYYRPLRAEIDALRSAGAVSEAMQAVLATASAEIETWHHVKDETGYLLVVARPR
ncbi:MAG: class I SAM-dependent methyltransferase [Pseudomonadota bacterium]